MINIFKYLAELVGTFVLTLAVGLSLAGTFSVPTPVIAALTLGLFVYTLGHISGTHLNPAVTLAAWSLRRVGANDALLYIIAQFIGAGAAFGFLRLIISPALLPVGNVMHVGVAEMLGAAVFTFGVAAVIYGRVPQIMSGFVVGGSLLIGISLASHASNGILNPAVALGIGSFSWMYVTGPVVGGVVGMWIFRLVSRE